MNAQQTRSLTMQPGLLDYKSFFQLLQQQTNVMQCYLLVDLILFNNSSFVLICSLVLELDKILVTYTNHSEFFSFSIDNIFAYLS